MTTVYVIRKCFMYDGDEVVAVCSTLEKAEKKERTDNQRG